MIGGRSSLLQGLCLAVLVVRQSMAEDIVVQGNLPYFASVRTAADSNHFCGASIITQRTAITAAHCVTNGWNTANLQVWAGTLNSDATSPFTQIRHISSISVHDGYVSGSTSNDIALVFVGRPFSYTAAVQPIQLPQASSAVDGIVMITGWTNSIVQGTYVPVIPYTICNTILPSGVLDEKNFCTGSFTGVGGICTGDHGSPTVRAGVLVGISVWNDEPCQLTLSPSVHIDINPKVTWIRYNMR